MVNRIIYGTPDGGGCIVEAGEAVRGIVLPTEEELARLQEIEEQVAEAIWSDPEFVDATEAWQVCMSDEGFDVSDRSEVAAIIDERLTEIFGFELTSEVSPEKMANSLSNADVRENLEGLLGEDRRLATLDVRCAKPVYEAQNSLYPTYYAIFSEQ